VLRPRLPLGHREVWLHRPDQASHKQGLYTPTHDETFSN
jgi:hypothetical protein